MTSSNKTWQFVFLAGVFIAAASLFAAYGWKKSVLSKTRDNLTSKQVKSKTPVAKSQDLAKPDPGYVGSQACTECHADIAKIYQTHPMARSITRVNETPEPHEDYVDRVSFNDGISKFWVERKDDRVWHHETVEDDEGVIFDQSEEIQYAMGSGAHGRSYLMWREGGLFISAVCWYTDVGWGLSPQLRSFRFSRRVNEDCLHCHAGRFVEQPGQENLYPQPVFHEMSVGCERCHGPGKAHIEFRQSLNQQSKDPIINPDKLGNAERDAVCYQCHFMGEGRFTRSGRHETDFRPGEKLSDNWLVFIKGTRSDKTSTEAVSQSLQMESSQCFVKSDGQMGCITCHSGHTVPKPAEMGSFYRQKCLTCHAEHGCSMDASERIAKSQDDSCIECHMPRLKTRGVPHASQSDHRILRKLPEAVPAKDPQPPVIYNERGYTVSKDESARARGLMVGQYAQLISDRRLAEENLANLKQSILKQPDDVEVLKTLGISLELLGRTFEADSCWKRILESDPNNEVALAALANSAHDHNRYLEATEFFARLVKIHAWKGTLRVRYANVLGQLGHSELALEQANIGLKIDPSMTLVYDWLARCYEHLGDVPQKVKYENLGHRLRKKQVH